MEPTRLERANPCLAKAVLSQLSYGPEIRVAGFVRLPESRGGRITECSAGIEGLAMDGRCRASCLSRHNAIG